MKVTVKWKIVVEAKVETEGGSGHHSESNFIKSGEVRGTEDVAADLCDSMEDAAKFLAEQAQDFVKGAIDNPD